MGLWLSKQALHKLQQGQGKALVDQPAKDLDRELLRASAIGDVATVRALVANKSVDVNTRDPVQKGGYAPLHWAARNGYIQVVDVLLNAGANPNVTNKRGETPLHTACTSHKSDVVQLLLAAGANIFAENNEKHKPLHKCLIAKNERQGNVLRILQILVSFGGEWDATCDEVVLAGLAVDEAPALRVCVLRWIEEHATGFSFTHIPFEVVKRGAGDTQAYIDAVLHSKRTLFRTLFRRKMCVIGSSQCGKTSLIKSISTGESALDHPDDRTMGIDIFKIEFTQGSDHYTITIWDYAGQETYQPAHAVFFSEHTAYVVCYDLHSGSLAKAQSDFRADDDVDYENRMDEFVSQKTLRWIRLVFSRQPDAEFVLVGTKADVIHHNASRIAEVKEDLLTRLKAYAADYAREVDREIAVIRDDDRVLESWAIEGELDRLRRLKQYASNMAPQQWLTMSCKEKQCVMTAKNDLQQLLVKTKDKSFEMPEAYANVLDLILTKRNASVHKRSRLRVHNAFISYDDLEMHLKMEIPNLVGCREILRTLHDLGDVLWYENLDTMCFQNTVVIDPQLLIDFIRQIFDHKHNGDTMPHTTLVGLPFWVDIATDDNLVLSLKQVLQLFHLVYPSSGGMKWDSDLIAPAYWRTNTKPFHQVVATPPQLEQGGATLHMRWEYHFASELPDAVYDHFVVKTYSPMERRAIGQTGILCEPDEKNRLVCRVVIQRKGRYTAIFIEAVATDDADWGLFIRYNHAMESVLDEFPGMLVVRCYLGRDGSVKRLDYAFTEIPIEAVRKGPVSTEDYIDYLTIPHMIKRRRRICVIGPSTWGKTSLIKSITTGESSLDHPDDRTIGIDIFAMKFDVDGEEFYITIWDYAGQEEYQPAHAVFFSERTFYVVCIDLHSTALATTQSDFRADDDADYEKRMDEFVAVKVLRWIRLVFARQPDAEFVLVGTKADVLGHSKSRMAEVREDLLTRLKDNAAAFEADVGREIVAVRKRLSESGTNNTTRNHLEETLARLQKQKLHARKLSPKGWLTMSCKEKERVVTAKNNLQQLLVNTKDKSFKMSEAHSHILSAIVKKREASNHKRTRERVRNTFVSYDDLAMSLTETVPELSSYTEILQTLHDLGDVLWYENLDTKCFKNTVIIDPLLLIDFIRQIFDHNLNGETMSHTTLVRRPFWVDIAKDSSLVLSLKQVLQHFHLVYPSRGDMKWDSQLLVPVYWRTNVQSYHEIVGRPLVLEQGDAIRRVRWEYHFSSELPEAVYDHFVVTTYSSLMSRVVGPDGIRYKPINNGTFACRAVVEREGLFTFIRVEALAGGSTKWHPFERLIIGMETVLQEFPGLLVTRNAIKSNGNIESLEVVVEDARDCDLGEIDWLPPDMKWYDKRQMSESGSSC